MTSRGKRKPRYGFDDIVMPRRLPRTGTRRQADNAPARFSISCRHLPGAVGFLFAGRRANSASFRLALTAPPQTMQDRVTDNPASPRSSRAPPKTGSYHLLNLL